MPDFWTHQTVKARKHHRCEACPCKIEPGETYLRVSGKWEGSMYSTAYHPECHEWQREANDQLGFYDSDEAQWLSDLVAEFGEVVLEGAPEIVRRRFDQPHGSAQGGLPLNAGASA